MKNNFLFHWLLLLTSISTKSYHCVSHISCNGNIAELINKYFDFEIVCSQNYSYRNWLKKQSFTQISAGMRILGFLMKRGIQKTGFLS